MGVIKHLGAVGAHFEKKQIILILSCLLFLPLAAMAADTDYGNVECKFIRAIDGVILIAY